jgi:AcrR family transcriptional regulator
VGDGARASVPPGEGRREPLTRPRILERALEMIDRDGIEGLSMRRLAAELDVSAMSLYNHVPNKEALLEGVAETLLAEIDLTGVELEDWTDAIRAGFRSFHEVLLAHPQAAFLIQTKPPATPGAMRPVELSLATLRRAGFDAQNALEAHWALVGYTLGHAMFQQSNPLGDFERGEGTLAAERALPPEDFPHVTEVLPEIANCDLGHAYDFGLNVIVEGLKAKLRKDSQRGLFQVAD